MNHKKKITDSKYTVNNPAAIAEMERALTEKLRAQQRRESITDFKLSGDMANQFNESQEDEELYDGQDPDGL